MPDLSTDIQKARSTSQKATQRATQLSAYAPSVGDVLRERAIDAYKANQDIIKPLDEATSSYLTAPQVAREKFQDVFNPFARERLVSQYTQQQALPVQALSSVLGQRFGNIEDFIRGGTGAFQAQVGAAQGGAQLARQNLQDLLDERAYQESVRQFNVQQSLEQQKLAAKDGIGFRDATDLRKEFNKRPEIKNMGEVTTSYNKIVNLAESEPSAAGDLGLIFSYMKLLDPTSVVREGEQATAQNATGVPAQIRNLYNKVARGDRLNPAQRADFANQAGTVYQSYLDTANQTANYYSALSQTQGIDPSYITGGLPTVDIREPIVPEADTGGGFFDNVLDFLLGPAAPSSKAGQGALSPEDIQVANSIYGY